MPTPRAIALLMPILVLAAGPALAKQKPYKIAAATRDAHGDWAPGDVLEETIGGVQFQMRYLDPAGTRSAVTGALGRDIDLLPGRVDEARPGFLVFVLQVENRSGAKVIYNPGHTRMASNKGDMKIALDYTALYELAMRHGPEAPEIHELDAILFDRSVTIEPGGSVRKLLAFEAPREDRYRTLDVQLLEIDIDGRAANIMFPFRKFYE